MSDILLIVIFVSSLWVFFDARKIGVKKGQIPGLADMGPGGWFFVCLLFWIIGFPLYIVKRGEFQKFNS